MSGTLYVTWTITASVPPMPVLPCARCGTQRRFASSGRFRLNANGKRLDAWLIYRCTACDQTWNRTVFERRARHAVDPNLLEALQRNDPDLAHRTALDLTGIKRWERAGDDAAVRIAKSAGSGVADGAVRLAVTMRVPTPVDGLRCDKLLALGLGLSRGGIERLVRTGRVTVEPASQSALSKPPRDGQQVLIAFDGLEVADRLAAAAAGRCAPAD